MNNLKYVQNSLTSAISGLCCGMARHHFNELPKAKIRNFVYFSRSLSYENLYWDYILCRSNQNWIVKKVPKTLVQEDRISLYWSRFSTEKIYTKLMHQFFMSYFQQDFTDRNLVGIETRASCSLKDRLVGDLFLIKCWRFWFWMTLDLCLKIWNLGWTLEVQLDLKEHFERIHYYIKSVQNVAMKWRFKSVSKKIRDLL